MSLIKIEKHRPWRDSDTEKSLRDVACIYQVMHLPTKATYIGTTSNAAHAYNQWVQRLRHSNTTPRLNVAIRSIYTKREDFYFGILEKHTSNVHIGYVLQKWIDKVKAHGQEFCLNIMGTQAEQEFWIDRTPIERRALLFETPAEPAPVKVRLVPGKYQMSKSIHDPRRAKLIREQAEAEQQGTLFNLGSLIKR